MKIETYICILSGDKWMLGFHSKHELFSTLPDTTGLVLTCKSCTDAFVNLNWKAVMPSHLTFSHISSSKALEHKELWPQAYKRDMLSHFSSSGVFSSLGNHKNHISPDTCHVLKQFWRLTLSSLACEPLKNNSGKWISESSPTTHTSLGLIIWKCLAFCFPLLD